MKVQFSNDVPVQISTNAAYILLTEVGGVRAVEYGEIIPFDIEGDAYVVPCGSSLAEIPRHIQQHVAAIRTLLSSSPQAAAWVDALESGRDYAECLACRLARSMDEAFVIERKINRKQAYAEIHAQAAEMYYIPEYADTYGGLSA